MSEKTETALVPAPQRQALVRPVASPADLIDAHKELATLITEALVIGTDYGVIPGTKTKPTLLKPGAERLAIAFGTYARYSILQSEIDHDRKVSWSKKKKIWKSGKFAGEEETSGTSLGLYRYVTRCELVRRSDGAVLADGIGSCSTLESKYSDRPRDCENTVLKMSEKRALVAAVLNGFGLSDRFTQDVEDQQDAEPESRTESPSATADQQRILSGYVNNAKLPEPTRRWVATQIDAGMTENAARKAIEQIEAKLLALTEVPSEDHK